MSAATERMSSCQQLAADAPTDRVLKRREAARKKRESTSTDERNAIRQAARKRKREREVGPLDSWDNLGGDAVVAPAARSDAAVAIAPCFTTSHATGASSTLASAVPLLPATSPVEETPHLAHTAAIATSAAVTASDADACVGPWEERERAFVSEERQRRVRKAVTALLDVFAADCTKCAKYRQHVEQWERDLDPLAATLAPLPSALKKAGERLPAIPMAIRKARDAFVDEIVETRHSCRIWGKDRFTRARMPNLGGGKPTVEPSVHMSLTSAVRLARPPAAGAVRRTLAWLFCTSCTLD